MLETVLFWFSLAALLVVLGITGVLWWFGLTMPRLCDLPAAEGDDLPAVSVVVAARNEERDIERGLESLLAIDYPRLELIAVDDRSTDQTGPILDRLAAADPRLQVVHVSELPAGWLGKNHALQVGAAAARGEYLLFTDADVVMQPDAVRRAVRYLRDTGFDHVCLTPECRLPGALLEAVVVTFAMFFTVYIRTWAVKDPHSSAYCGIGAFNLLRAEAFRAVGGFEPIRLRPDDDIKLGKLLKKHGFRQDVLSGVGAIWVPWYATLDEIILGLEKNAFAGIDYSLPLAAINACLVVWLNLWPFAGVFVPLGWSPWLCGASAALQLVNYAAVAWNMRARWWLAPLYPAAVALFLYIQLRGVAVTLWRGGITWRDTHYPLDELMRNEV